MENLRKKRSCSYAQCTKKEATVYAYELRKLDEEEKLKMGRAPAPADNTRVAVYWFKVNWNFHSPR